MRKYGPSSNPEAFNKFIKIADIFQSLGSFVEDGIFDIKPIYERSGFTIIAAWEKMEPIIRGIRKHSHNSVIFPKYEYLYDELMKYREKHFEQATNP